MSDEQKKERRELRITAAGIPFFALVAGALMLLGPMFFIAALLMAACSVILGHHLGVMRAYYKNKWPARVNRQP